MRWDTGAAKAYPSTPPSMQEVIFVTLRQESTRKIHWILDLACFFHQSDSARDVSIRENPICWKLREPFHWFNLTLQSLIHSTQKMVQNTWVSFGVASKPKCHRFSSDQPMGKGGKGAKRTFYFFPLWFLFMLDLQQVTATVTLQTEAANRGSSAKKGSFEFCHKSLPPGAWRYNSTLTLIYFIALFAVFRFNYWLVLLQKGNVLLYQLPGREFSENNRILQREVIIFHLPWKILVQDISEVCLMHCHRFTGNIKFSWASKIVHPVPWRCNSSLRYSE